MHDDGVRSWGDGNEWSGNLGGWAGLGGGEVR